MRNYLTPFSRIDSMIDDFFNDRTSIFDRANRLSGNYNVIKISDDIYQIALNVAGFNREDIEVIHDEDVLIIKGSVSQAKDKDKYIYQGFSSSFHNSFSIGRDAEILNAEIKDGILIIEIKDYKHISNQPKKIFIK
jgi:molecular chaperone IbpA